MPGHPWPLPMSALLPTHARTGPASRTKREVMPRPRQVLLPCAPTPTSATVRARKPCPQGPGELLWPPQRTQTRPIQDIDQYMRAPACSQRGLPPRPVPPTHNHHPHHQHHRHDDQPQHHHRGIINSSFVLILNTSCASSYTVIIT